MSFACLLQMLKTCSFPYAEEPTAATDTVHAERRSLLKGGGAM